MVDYAKVHGYIRYTSTLKEAWRISIAALNEAMYRVLETNRAIPLPDIDDNSQQSEIYQFGAEEVRKHRSRGVTLAMFMGLAKYYRRSYFDLVRAQNYSPPVERDYLQFLETFFDQFEIGYCIEWDQLNQEQTFKELRSTNRALTNEKNKYLTIFESLYDPVILLDNKQKIENANQAAADLLQQYLVPNRYYDPTVLRQPLPWLEAEVRAFADSEEQELILVRFLPTRHGDRHYQIKMKRMQDISGKYPGVVIILNDLSDRLEKEAAITRNRAIQRWVNLLVELSRCTAGNAGTEEALQLAMSALPELVPADALLLGLWHPGRFIFHSAPYKSAPNGVDPDIGRDTQHPPSFVPSDLEAVRSGRESPLSHRKQLFATLETKECLLGMLWLGRNCETAFTASEQMIIDSIAQQLTFALEHAKLTDRLQTNAIVEERARLAREMHDGLLQILGFLSLEMQSLKLLVQQGKLDETLAELELARERILEAQAEVRDNILNLRTSLDKEGEAITLLCDLLWDFARQSGIRVFIDKPDPLVAPLPSISEVHLLRIVQEAINNIRQHADASRVDVKFAVTDQALCVNIVDDGIGFNESHLKKHFGLKSMRERAQTIGGHLQIESRVRQGTRVMLSLPILG